MTPVKPLPRLPRLPRRLLAMAALCTLLFLALQAQAAPFEIALSPSRLEIEAKSGERIGRSLDLYNVGSAPTAVSVRTLDWS